MFRFTKWSGPNGPGSEVPPAALSLMVWGVGVLFYVMAFFQRVAPAVMTTELMAEFRINAVGLGHLSALYFYSYVAMQIPTGLLADVWGPRRLLTAGAVAAGLGTLIFALSSGFFWAGTGRFLIGGSVAVAFVGLLQLTGRWFPPRRFALVSGLTLFCGHLGAVMAGPPLRMLLNAFGWRPLLLGTAVATLVIGLAIWCLVRDFPHEMGYRDHAPECKKTSGSGPGGLAGIAEVFRYRNIRLLFFIPGSLVGAMLAFSGLWGVPFLTTRYGLPPTQASTLTSSLLLGWGLGGPVFGWASDRLGRRKSLYLLGLAVALSGWSVTVLVPNLPLAVLIVVLPTIGFFSGAMILSFALARESVPNRLSGTVSGVVNAGVMIGPMLLQPAIGWILDLKWQGELSAGVRIYSFSAYRTGFSLMLVWLALAFLLLFFIRETHCRPAA